VVGVDDIFNLLVFGVRALTALGRMGCDCAAGFHSTEMDSSFRNDSVPRRLAAGHAPQLLEQPGVGPHAAAQLILSWSHQGRITSEAAFARLAGAAPIPASSGQTIRHRLDRSGDRKLNRALHMILVTRKRSHPATIE
jgi:hypothetical protein